MASAKPFKMVARDGVELHGYLTIPKGSDGKNLPLIVHPHGGPHGPRDFWTFTPDAQVLASRGYAVLQINFRGSGGYGREFLYSGYGEWGATMQDDVTDATLWAIEQGHADAKRICIYGASYGGYAALMGVVKEPDLYQCAIGFVGVYSLPMMFEKGDIPDSRFGQNYLKEALGEDINSLKSRSPAYNVDKIKADVMLVHGGKDERVPIEQAEFLMAQFDKIGKPYEWFVKKREGHGFYKPENRLELYQKQLAFFDKHIGPADN
jgi:dipeptidyl aminopeptidase/acylaminoacyl peptidase